MLVLSVLILICALVPIHDRMLPAQQFTLLFFVAGNAITVRSYAALSPGIPSPMPAPSTTQCLRDVAFKLKLTKGRGIVMLFGSRSSLFFSFRCSNFDACSHPPVEGDRDVLTRCRIGLNIIIVIMISIMMNSNIVGHRREPE